MFLNVAFGPVATHQKTQQGLKHIIAGAAYLTVSLVATHQKTQQGLKLDDVE